MCFSFEVSLLPLFLHIFCLLGMCGNLGSVFLVGFLWNTNNLHGITFLLTCLKLRKLESSKEIKQLVIGAHPAVPLALLFLNILFVQQF